MAMIIEQAGGLAYSGAKRTLEHQPNEVHELVPVLLGSRGEVEKVREFVG
jgi:fructose-1,6-bisphosphatase I